MSTRLAEQVTFSAGVTAANRCWLAPMTNLQSHADGTLADAEHAWLLRRAGFGVVETCAAYVAEDGQGWPGELGVAADRHDPGLALLAGDLTAAGAVAIPQLFHGGVRAPRAVTGTQPWSASTWHEDGPDLETRASPTSPTSAASSINSASPPSAAAAPASTASSSTARNTW